MGRRSLTRTGPGTPLLAASWPSWPRAKTPARPLNAACGRPPKSYKWRASSVTQLSPTAPSDLFRPFPSLKPLKERALFFGAHLLDQIFNNLKDRLSHSKNVFTASESDKNRPFSHSRTWGRTCFEKLDFLIFSKTLTTQGAPLKL